MSFLIEGREGLGEMGERVGRVRKKENRKERERERKRERRKKEKGERESKKLLFVIAFELQKTTINGSLL